MSNTVKRTVRSEFMLRGERVMPGQVVNLSPLELERYAAAETVYADDRRNAEVPVVAAPKPEPAAKRAPKPAVPEVSPAGGIPVPPEAAPEVDRVVRETRAAQPAANPAPTPPAVEPPAKPAPATRTSGAEKPRFR